MAVHSLRNFIENELGSFPNFVIYGTLELTLIILLFLDGFISFFCNEFAKFFELQLPCLLCTRIDHVIFHKNSNTYYNNAICESHKKKVSSLAYCHLHTKLSDIRTMCEACLLSFSSERESDTDTYRSLAGTLHKDIDTFMENDYSRFSVKNVKDDTTHSDVQRCSCCGEPRKVRTASKTMNRNFSSNGSFYQVPSSPRSHMLAFRNEVKLTPENDTELTYQDAYGSLSMDKPFDMFEDIKTPTYSKGNKFFGIPLTDSTSVSPRFANRSMKKSPLEKSESVLESNDLNPKNMEAVDGGDSMLSRLRKQVLIDRKLYVDCCTELEEERSASAVAANNAMAMITRLQAEKAAVQMEALQYQRMMEEQAEYDQEAIQTMKDLLMKRDDRIKILEGEVDTYRERYGIIPKLGSDECEVDANDDYQEFGSRSSNGSQRLSECESTVTGFQVNNVEEQSGSSFQEEKERGEDKIEESLTEFEQERSQLLGMLTVLEKNMQLSSIEEEDEPNSPQPISYTETNADDLNKGVENKVVLKREVSLLRERLRAMEAESGFIKHATMTLQRGTGEGTELLREVAQHLRELRQSSSSLSENTNDPSTPS
ncbi:probable myosin-binding protein 5 [Impatiens glandulifera]|uniref:probable myosin-binding protein 5 n=1 Tax=Impatiens glandulifera TaxID=253017 RepID=UPI001FB141A6|nr:probable myosin-binding protein 5 [Impatiens glandulifera]